MEGEIDALRKQAPDWSLAGDQQLLDVLQNLHLRIVSRCEETSRRLEEMVTALDDTSIHLQNVNNKFMALSNTQFVESRVYDDDVEVTKETNTQGPLQPAVEDSVSALVDSVRQLMAHHHSVVILLDTDSSSDSDAEHCDSVVLKMKDVYARRPLPYVIGSDGWNNKRHCGLVAEDSDPDSSEARSAERDQYSDSDADSYWDHQQQSSSTVSSPPAAPAPPPPPPAAPPAAPARSPADIAAELARKLAAHAPVVEKVPEREPELPSSTVVRKTYRPEQPAAATIFPDEPPPLGQVCESERDSNTDEEDDDIFAQLRTEAKKRVRNNDAIVRGNSDAAKDIAHVVPHPTDVKPNQALYDEVSKREKYVEKQGTTNNGSRAQETQEQQQNKDIIKKPVGGISVFGPSQGAGSIGAAILKRNQRKSSSDEDEQIANIKTIPSVVEDKTPKESDIFNDLFAKPAQSSKNISKNKTVEPKTAPKVDIQTKDVAKPKMDLFSDSLFDDIDDLFTTNVKSVAKPSDKSNFDDGQLFADVAVVKNEESSKNDTKNTKSIFDSDDDLFNENPQTSAPVTSNMLSANTSKDKIITKNTAIKKSIFDDEDSGDDLFSNYKNITDKKAIVKIQEKVAQVRETKSIFDDSDDDDMFLDTKTTKINTNTPSQPPIGTQTADKDELLIPKESISKRSDATHFVVEKVIQDTSEVKVPITVEETHKTLITQNSVKDRAQTEVSVTINETPEKPPEDVFEDNDWDEEPIDNLAGGHMQKDNLLIKPNNNALSKNSPSIFDDDDIDDLLTTQPSNEPALFTNTSQPEKTSVVKQSDNNSKREHSVPINNVTSSTDFDNTNFNNNSSSATKSSVFNDTDDNDIFMGKRNTNNKDNTVTSDKSEVSLTNPDIVHNLATNKTVTEDEVLFSTIQSTISNKADDFTDIFVDQPPDFEKPKEPKRSKNVNALFDDDSEDEALFFKKSDPVLDEKPEVFDQAKQELLFGLFHDEPPEIEPDFVQKSNKKSENPHKSNSESNNIATQDSDSDTKQGSQVNVRDSDVDKLVSDDIPSEGVVPKSSETKQQDNETINREKKENEKIQESKTVGNMIEDAEKLERDGKPHDTEPKKAVGKLKPMNFNINVNALVPGSIPKKTQKIIEPVDKTDGNVLSARSNEELHISDNVPVESESKLVKSVSFDGSPDNTVLDNKLSKERAKIQVKRRPSTRRARREAVRKSAIDIGDDSTDNSSSVDDIRSVDVKAEPNDDFNIKPQLKDDPPVNIEQKLENKPTTLQKELNLDTANDNAVETTEPNTQQVKSKTVYILNDEDIFPTAKTEENIIAATTINTDKPKSLLILDDDDDIFRTGGVKAETIKPPTLGSIYADVVKTDERKSESTEKLIEESKTFQKPNTDSNKTNIDKETTIPKAKPSLFGDSSDEELFGAKKKPADVKSNKLFDSDSDDGLFTGKVRAGGKLLEQRKDVAKALAKGSLFDDDDEDDLFGGNKDKTTESKPALGKTSTEKSTPQPTTSVFVDPLSMLGDAED